MLHFVLETANPPSGFWNNVQQNAKKILDNLNAMAEILGDDFNTICKDNVQEKGNLQEKREALPEVICLLEILNALDDPNNLIISENTPDPAVIEKLESSYELEMPSNDRAVSLREGFFDALNEEPIEAFSKWFALMQLGGESSR